MVVVVVVVVVVGIHGVELAVVDKIEGRRGKDGDGAEKLGMRWREDRGEGRS